MDVLPSTQYTLSCYVKKINYRYVQLRNPTSRSATFDFDTKTFLGVSTDVDATGYEDVGNGWFRIWSTATQPATGHNALVDIAFANSSGTSSFTPAGTETVYIWGAQFETGSAATSYREIAGSNAVNVVPNNFTPNSITAANQSTNTPSLVYPTMNPLSATDGADMTLSEGNLKVATTTNSRTLFATQGITEGAYYFEIEVVSYATGGGSALGIADGGFANDVYFTSASMITSAIGMTTLRWHLL